MKNLYGFLVDQNYLMGNPWSAVGVPRTAGPKGDAGRSFSLAQWDFIERQLKMLPATSANQRLTFGLHLQARDLAIQKSRCIGDRQR